MTIFMSLLTLLDERNITEGENIEEEIKEDEWMYFAITIPDHTTFLHSIVYVSRSLREPVGSHLKLLPVVRCPLKLSIQHAYSFPPIFGLIFQDLEHYHWRPPRCSTDQFVFEKRGISKPCLLHKDSEGSWLQHLVSEARGL